MSRLTELTAIEDTIGIDVLTLFKALEDGIWIMGYNGPCNIDVSLACSSGEWHLEERLCENPDWFYFNEYGKMWALTKEGIKEKDYGKRFI